MYGASAPDEGCNAARVSKYMFDDNLWNHEQAANEDSWNAYSSWKSAPRLCLCDEGSAGALWR